MKKLSFKGKLHGLFLPTQQNGNKSAKNTGPQPIQLFEYLENETHSLFCPISQHKLVTWQTLLGSINSQHTITLKPPLGIVSPEEVALAK